jgi:drug/metabolite transporter (DMT)-like permease
MAGLIFFYSIKYTTSANAQSLFNMSPILSYILGLMFYQEKVILRKIVILFISFIGVIFIV